MKLDDESRLKSMIAQHAVQLTEEHHLEAWKIDLYFNGSWWWKDEDENTIAKCEPVFQYRRAKIIFHKNAIKQLPAEELIRLLRHEIMHVVLSEMHHVSAQNVDVCLAALRDSCMRRFTTAEEKTVSKFERSQK